MRYKIKEVVDIVGISDSEAYKESHKKTSKYTKANWSAIMEKAGKIYT